MIALRKTVARFSMENNFYPYFLSPNYTALRYAPQYLDQFKKLKFDRPNMFQIDHDRLPQHMIEQIQSDKSLFLKEKEIFFIGRSNSGKSSLINQIFKNNQKDQLRKNKKLARVAKRTGTTQFLHFHHLHNCNTFVVDSPGYGFAQMNKRRRQIWLGMIEEYLKVSSRVSQIFLCINFEHGLQNTDIHFLQRIHNFNIDIQPILTKRKYFGQFQAINEALRRLGLQNINDRVIACSSKNDFGMDIVRCRILQAIEKSKPRNIDGKQNLLISYLKQLRVTPQQLQMKQQQLSREHIVRKLIYNSKLTKFLR